MNNYKIKNATAEYTGGGIYIYYGELENGLFFRACDDWESFISICDSDTSVDAADYGEFYHEHEIDELQNYEAEVFFNNIIEWIATNEPGGNYNINELESRTYKHIETDIVIEDARTLAKTLQEQVKKEHFEKMLKHQIRMISDSMSEYKNNVRFIFNDNDYYRRDFEKEWKNEFYNQAVRLFKDKGYYIKECIGYNLIEW